MEVVHMHSVFGRVPADFIGGADNLASLDAPAGHPDGESVRMVIAAGSLWVSSAVFAKRSAAELAGPDDEGFLEEPSTFQIVDQGSDGLVAHLGVGCELSIEIGMMIP